MTAAVMAGRVNMGPAEQLNISISFVNRLNTGETLAGSATATLRDQDYGEYPAGLSGSPQVGVSSVTQKVGPLRSGHTYLLDISIGTNQTQTLEGQIIIICEGEPHQL